MLHKIISNRYHILISVILIAIQFLFLINTLYTLWPEMLAYPYLINKGFVLYKDIVNPYPPLFNYFLSVITNIFEAKPLTIKLLTWTIILITDLSIILFSTYIHKKSIFGLLSLFIFVFLSIPMEVNGLWYDMVVTPLLLLTFFLFIKGLNEKRRLLILMSSVLFSVALFTKQQSLIILLPITYLLIKKVSKQNLFRFIKENFIAALFPILFLIIFLTLFHFQNNLNNFVYYSLIFPLKASSFPGYVQFPTVKQVLILISILGLFAPIYTKKKQNIYFLTGILLFLFAYPRFAFFHLIPSAVFLSVAFPEVLNDIRKSKISVLIFLCSLIIFGVFFTQYSVKKYSKEDRFVEQKIIYEAAVLKIIVGNSSVYVQNAPDQLIALADLNPVKPWAIQFPWYFENSSLEQKTIESINIQKPEYIIYKPYENQGKYELASYKPEHLAKFIDQNYTNYFQISPDLWLKKRI